MYRVRSSRAPQPARRPRSAATRIVSGCSVPSFSKSSSNAARSTRPASCMANSLASQAAKPIAPSTLPSPGRALRTTMLISRIGLGNVVDRPVPRIEALFEPYAHLRLASRQAFGLERQDLVALVLVEIDRAHIVGERVELDAVGPLELEQRLHAAEQRRTHALVLQQRGHEQERDVGP